MKITSILIAVGMAVTATVSAGPWELSLGLVHRSVGDFDLDGVVFANPNLSTPSPYVTGVLDGDLPNSAYVVDYGRQGGGTALAALHSIDFADDSEGMDSSTGVLLAARTELGERWGMPWFLSLNALWFGSDASTSGTVAGTTYHFVADDTSWGDFGPNTVVLTDVTSGNLDSVYGTYEVDLDLDAFTFGIGLGTDVVLPVGALRLEVGPSLTVVDYDESATTAAYWSSDDVPVYSAVRTSDDGVDFLGGLYGDLSFAYDFNERFGVGLGIRYDYVYQKLETDLGDVDLSGFSAMLKFQVRF